MKVSATVLILAMLAAAGSATGQTEDGTSDAGIRVSEYGVGTGVKELELVGEAESFPAGSRVWFWTRVVGGRDGDRIRHVWIHEGKVVFSIGLSIGGDHWRTYSNKLLHAAGKWTAEVRSAEDEVLARQEFVATPAD